MKRRVLLALFILLPMLLPVLLTGCRKDQKGQASLSVQTTLPREVEVTLVSTERVGTYVQRANTDFTGRVQFVGIRPGMYKLVFQFTRPSISRSDPAYNYGESEPFEVLPGNNRTEWTAGTNEVTRLD